ncbi:MAG: hypothetical protein JWP75_3532 [Frondihabitans sp.]|nr:hypothetical protein [Frondihabitans sp.]
MAVEQYDEAWFEAASPDDLVVARAAGRLDDLLETPRNEAGVRLEDLRGIGPDARRLMEGN